MAPPHLDEKTIVTFFKKEFNYDVAPVFQPAAKDVAWMTYNMYKFIIQSVFQLNDNFFASDPEQITAGAFPYLRVATVLHRLLTDLQPDQSSDPIDFSITDIIMPQPKKTRIFLSWLIPYYELVRERREFVEDVFGELEQRKMDLEKEQFEVMMLEKQVNDKRRLVDEMKRHKNEMYEKASRLEDEYRRKMDAIEERKALFDKKRDELNALVEQLKEEQAALKAEKEENSNLEKNIVKSPERLLKEIDTLKESIEEVNDKLVDTEQSLRDMQRRKAELGHVMENCVTLVKELDKIEAKWHEYRQVLDIADANLQLVEEANKKLGEVKKQVDMEKRKQLEEITKKAQEKQQLEDQLELKREEKTAMERELGTEQEREKRLQEENRQLSTKHKDMQKKFDEIDVKFNESIRGYFQKAKEVKQKILSEEKVLNATTKQMHQFQSKFKELDLDRLKAHLLPTSEDKENSNKVGNSNTEF